ncbi:MAG: hypothetical protein M3512_10465, partial [Bacteroidota bacterium]|nr:hypothetical protein [Bacteroidota bacterium]
MKINYSIFKKYLLIISLIICSTRETFADNVETLTIEDFLILIMEKHPVAKQAALLSEQARQELRVARGMMDPTLNSRLYRKELGGENYFTLWDNTLR